MYLRMFEGYVLEESVFEGVRRHQRVYLRMLEKGVLAGTVRGYSRRLF